MMAYIESRKDVRRDHSDGNGNGNGIGDRDNGTTLAATIAALETQDAETLRTTWRRRYRASPPDRINRDLLARVIAFRLQEVALGGLRPAAKRKLAAWSDSLADGEGEQGDNAVPAAAVRLKPGATLIRTWRGMTHTVQVIEDGFEHQGIRYASLSQIAQVITGTHWSGPRFFGLTGAHRPQANGATAKGGAHAPIV